MREVGEPTHPPRLVLRPQVVLYGVRQQQHQALGRGLPFLHVQASSRLRGEAAALRVYHVQGVE